MPGAPDGIAMLRTFIPSVVHSSKNTGFVFMLAVLVGLPPMNAPRSSPRRTTTRLPGPNGMVAVVTVADGDAVIDDDGVAVFVAVGEVPASRVGAAVSDGEGVKVAEAEQADTERTLTEPDGPPTVDNAPLLGHVAEPGLYVAHAGL